MSSIEDVIALIDEMGLEETKQVCEEEDIPIDPAAGEASLPWLHALLRYHLCGVPLPEPSVPAPASSPTVASLASVSECFSVRYALCMHGYLTGKRSCGSHPRLIPAAASKRCRPWGTAQRCAGERTVLPCKDTHCVYVTHLTGKRFVVGRRRSALTGTPRLPWS
jgi:hypothetical protein